MGEQQSYYRENEEYAEFLEGWDPSFYAKYADTLCPDEPGGKALDVGCGQGALARRLRAVVPQVAAIDLDPTSIDLARRRYGTCASTTCSATS